jgi:hypothetical protein
VRKQDLKDRGILPRYIRETSRDGELTDAHPTALEAYATDLLSPKVKQAGLNG